MTKRFRKTFLFFTLFLLANFLFSQKVPMKWGKISNIDLGMTHYEQEPEATALVLGEFAKLTFENSASKGLVYRFQYHKRIKLFKSSAFDLGNISIPYYSYNNSEKVAGIKAQVILPNGTKIKIKNRDIYKDEVNKYYSIKKFAIPNLQEGCIIEYKYNLISNQIATLQDWYFQGEVPIRHSELRLEIPEFLDYIFLYQARDNITKSNVEGVGAGTDFEGVDMRHVTFILKNISALKEESYITTMDDYRARIKFQLREYDNENGIRLKYLTSWKKLAQKLLEDTSYGHQFLKKRKHKKMLAKAQAIMAKAPTDKEKIRAAQKFICENITWNKKYSKYPDDNDNLDRLFEKKQAGSGAMNLMLLTILRKEGLKAWPLLTSTRSHGKMIPLYPIFDQFNHTMVYVELEGENLVLDAHDAFHPAGYPSIGTLNSLGWVVDEKNPRWIDLLPPKSSVKYLSTFSLNEEGTLTGTLAGIMEGYHAINEREDFNDKNDGGWKNSLAKKYPESKVDSITIENQNDLYKPFKLNIECEIPGAAQVNGDFMYLSPILQSSFQKNPFKLEKRSYPVDIPYPFREIYVLNLLLPEGYVVEELPEPAKLALPNKGGKFKFFVKAIEGNRLQLISDISISQLYFDSAEYQNVKYYFDLIVEKQGEQIVLKKQK